MKIPVFHHTSLFFLFLSIAQSNKTFKLSKTIFYPTKIKSLSILKRDNGCVATFRLLGQEDSLVVGEDTALVNGDQGKKIIKLQHYKHYIFVKPW